MIGCSVITAVSPVVDDVLVISLTVDQSFIHPKHLTRSKDMVASNTLETLHMKHLIIINTHDPVISPEYVVTPGAPLTVETKIIIFRLV